ncbi:MAG: glycerophosphodiester phosphodiesterase [Anaerolineales bacterium]|nr:MAG: glycerophosphodiester phosphodiesterase [Anaerolineales bacterium]
MPDKRNWDSSAPLVIAHRGASMYAPENTIAAFDLAVEMGADAIELDAMLTEDGTPIVIHDHSLGRTTDSSGSVSSKIVSEIKLLDAGSIFDARFAGEMIPTLEEVFSAVGDKIMINVELKNYASPFDSLPETVGDLVREKGLSDRVLLSSFNPMALIKAKRACPEIRRAALIGGGPKVVSGFIKTFTNYSALHPEVSLVNRGMVIKNHAAGHKVNVWNVNEESEMIKLLSMGVDGLITDAPDIAKKVIGARARETTIDGK